MKNRKKKYIPLCNFILILRPAAAGDLRRRRMACFTNFAIILANFVVFRLDFDENFSEFQEIAAKYCKMLIFQKKNIGQKPHRNCGHMQRLKSAFSNSETTANIEQDIVENGEIFPLSPKQEGVFIFNFLIFSLFSRLLRSIAAQKKNINEYQYSRKKNY